MDAGRNQLGRRNLSPDDFTLILGRRYNRMKRSREDNLKQNQPIGQNVPSVNTAKTLSEQHNVSEKTVRRAGQYADAVDTITIEEDFDHKTYRFSPLS